MRSRPRVIPYRNWDAVADTTSLPPDQLLEQLEENGGPTAEPASQLPADTSQLHELLSYWIGPLDPIRSLRITADIAQLRTRRGASPDCARWLADHLKLRPADVQRTIQQQLRAVWSLRGLWEPPRSQTLSVSALSTGLPLHLLQWLLDGAALKNRHALLLATRGAYLLATRVEPSLIANQSLATIGTLWGVSSEALSNQADALFSGTGITGTYNTQQRLQRSRSAKGNHSQARSR